MVVAGCRARGADGRIARKVGRSGRSGHTIPYMPCQWKTDVPCAFADHDEYGNNFVVYEGRLYCGLHLPLGSDQKANADSFSFRFRALQEAGYGDFCGTAFPGTAIPNESPRIEIVGPGILKSSTVGNRLTIFVNNVRCDLSESTFVGANSILAMTSHAFVCERATFAGDVVLEGGNQPSYADLAESRFEAAC